MSFSHTIVTKDRLSCLRFGREVGCHDVPISQSSEADVSRRGLREGWIVAALAIYALARLASPLDGLTPYGQAVLGAMTAGAILWISEAVPIGLTAIVVLVLLALSPGKGLADAAVGFTSPVVFFLIGAVALGAAVE